MHYVHRLAQWFQMSDRVWQRHANPWSVYTRYFSLPVLVLAGWSRVWWGGWAIVPGLVAIAWIWLNPRLFPTPRSTENWASKSVIGERIWLNQADLPIPAHHAPLIRVTTTINAVGFGLCVWGLITLHLWPTLLGLSWVILGKTWFLDRMVWLCEEMRQQPPYADWLY